MDLAKQPLPQEMELANQPPPQEIPLRQTSSLGPNSAAIGAVSLPAQAVGGGWVALVLPGLRLIPSRGGESGPETVELSCLFRLWSVLRRESRPATERREKSSGHWPWIFRFRRAHSIFYPTRLLFHPTHSVFQLTRPRVRPTPFSVEQVVVQRRNLVFGRSKSSRKK